MVTALIFAGGSGKRMKNEDIPKQFLKVNEKPIIVMTLEHFCNHKEVDEIVVVCIESWIDELKKYINEYGLKKIVSVIPGGSTGYRSIHLGLLEIAGRGYADDDIVLICDGVRPILTQELISNCIADTKKYETAVPVKVSTNSVMYSEDGKTCSKNFSRDNIYITQAPQGFTMKKILDAHKVAQEKGLETVSSADLMIEIGETIHIFDGIIENIKVTTPEDLHMLRSTMYYEHFRMFAQEEAENYE